MTDVMEAFQAVEQGDVAHLRRLLEARPGLAEARNGAGLSLLLFARYRSELLALEAILEARPELDIFEASSLGRTERVEELLATDPGVATETASDGYTPLHLAAFFGHLDAARLLVEAGAEVDAVSMDAQRLTPLHSAAAGRHPEIVELLLGGGADPNVRQRGGWTPLHAAAQNGDSSSVEALLAAGADATARHDGGSSAADLAEEAELSELAARLRT